MEIPVANHYSRAAPHAVSSAWSMSIYSRLFAYFNVKSSIYTALELLRLFWVVSLPTYRYLKAGSTQQALLLAVSGLQLV